MTKPFLLILVMVALASTGYPQSGSSLAVNMESFLVSPANGNQRYPVSAYASGVHLIVWQEGNETWAGNSDIRGLIVGDDGAYGISFSISNANNVPERPAITTDGTNFFVVWQSLPGNGTDYNVYGARVTPGGRVLDAIPIAIANDNLSSPYNTHVNQAMPAVAFDGTNYVVAWMDNRLVAQSYHIRAVRVSTSGAVLDSSSVALMGNTSYSDIMSAMNNDFGNVPTMSAPAIACYQQKCIVIASAKETTYGQEEMFPSGLRVIHINSPADSNSSISLDGTPFRPTTSTAYGTYTYPASAWPEFYPSFARTGEKYFLVLGTNWMAYAYKHLVAVPIFDNTSTGNPPSVINKNSGTTLSIDSAGYPAMTGRTTSAMNGSNVIVLWATCPGDSSYGRAHYVLMGATIDGSNNVSKFAVFDSAGTYRGFPTVSMGDSHNLLVYEKDAGASGIQLAGILFDKNGLPLNVIPAPLSTFDFSLSSGGNQSVAQGGSISNSIAASVLSGVSQPVAFSIADLPTGVTAAFSSGICAPTCTSMITISTLSNAAPGSYLLTVTGNYGVLSHSTSFSLTVTSATPPPPSPPTPSAPSRPGNLHFVSGQPGTLSIPITVQEALPSGVAGMARTLEPVTVGIPLAVDSGITTVNQLGLSGSDVGQFRALARWPNGNIKWVLIDTQASVSAGGTASVTLTNAGSGNFGGSNLAVDNGGTITVSTGAAAFVIRKANFNVFDSAVVDGTTLVTTGNSGGVRAISIDGNTTYSSINDSSSTASIEENGPVRVCIKAAGAVKDTGGNRLLDYTLRLHFYRNKSYVKAFVTMRNASQAYVSSAYFKSFEVVVPMTLGSAKTVEYTLSNSSVPMSLATNDTFYLMQGFSNGSNVANGTDTTNWDPPVWPPTCIGLGIHNGSATIKTFGSGHEADYTQGYAGLEDNTGRGVALSLRWMSSYWPAGFEMKGDGTTSIELFSKYNSGAELKLKFKHHEEREILWDFYTDNRDNRVALYDLQYPLIAHASLSHYQSAKGIFGQIGISSKAQQEQFFLDMNQSYLPNSPSLSNPTYPATNQLYRWYAWGNPGGGNQTDFPLEDLMDYLRTGNAGFYLRGEQRAKFVYNTAVPYSDDFFDETIGSVIDNIHPDWAGINGPNYAESTTYIEHDHVMSMPFLYYITGNEGAKDAFNEYGQWLELGPGAPNDPYFRQWARKYRNMALLYQFSCETSTCRTQYNGWVKNATDFMLDSKSETPSNNQIIGRSLTRGYQYWDTTVGDPTYATRVIHSLFHTQMHFEAVYQVQRIMAELGQQYRDQELTDYMLGLAHFYFDEMYAYDPAELSTHRYGFMMNYPLDLYVAPATGSWTNQMLQPYDASRAAVFLYENTGDASYLGKAGILTVEITGWATDRSPSELQDQALIYAYYNLASTPVWKPLVLTQQSNGSGSYAISWTVPTGATKVQIKYSDRPIVEWLGFDKVTRSYQYDPSQHTAFFAAQSIAGTLTPQGTGSVQTTTITLDPGRQWYFSAKYLSNTR